MQDHTYAQNSNFAFKGTKIEFVLDENNELWLKAKVIAHILQYNNARRAIEDFVPENYKSKYEALSNQDCVVTHLLNAQPDMVFVNEHGLYKLINSSTLTEAALFRNWVYEELLPKIRRIGKSKLLEKLKRRNRLIENLHQELLQTRQDRVIRTLDPAKNPEFCLIKKNDDAKYPYYVLRVQKQNIQTRLNEITRTYPRMKLLLKLKGNPYTVNLYNRIKQSGCIEFHRNDLRTGLSEQSLINLITATDYERF